LSLLAVGITESRPYATAPYSWVPLGACPTWEGTEDLSCHTAGVWARLQCTLEERYEIPVNSKDTFGNSSQTHGCNWEQRWYFSQLSVALITCKENQPPTPN